MEFQFSHTISQPKHPVFRGSQPIGFIPLVRVFKKKNHILSANKLENTDLPSIDSEPMVLKEEMIFPLLAWASSYRKRILEKLCLSVDEPMA